MNFKRIKSNLWRNKDSGKYYARWRNEWKSLDTTLRSVADLKLPPALAKMKAEGGALKGADLTLGECAAVYLHRKKERGYRRRDRNGRESAKSKPLKPRSMDYRQETVEALRLRWDGFDEEIAALVPPAKCHAVADRLRRDFGPTRFNGIVQSMRGIFDIAVESGARTDNPANDVYFAEVKPSSKPIPTREQTTEIFRLLDAHPRRKYARLSLRALAFTGLRPNEARHLRPEDLDLVGGTLTARETKNGKPRTIQLIPQAIQLFKDEGVNKVLAALKKDPRRTIRTIGAKIGLEMTPYTMRHLHMSALVESGMDIATAAQIAGHQDRGVTLLRHYAHTRAGHVRKQLEKVII